MPSKPLRRCFHQIVRFQAGFLGLISLAFADQASIDFGRVPSQQSTAQSITISLSANTSSTLGLAYGVDFSISSSSCTTTGTLKNCTAVVVFQPSQGGTTQDSLQLTNSSGQVLTETLLVGTGISSQITVGSSQIDTSVGNGTWGYAGDQSPAIQAFLRGPEGVTVSPQGDVYIADSLNHVIRKVSADGTISTVAGVGTKGWSGDGSLATAAQLNIPTAVALDSSGNLLIADCGNNRIRSVDLTTKVIDTIAGTDSTYSVGNGDGGPARMANLSCPSGIAISRHGDIYVSDFLNNAVRKIDWVSGIIITIAGNGSASTNFGDGGPSINAVLSRPIGITFDSTGNLYIADSGNARVRKVDALTGVITTVAGNDQVGYSGDGSSASNASLNSPYAVAISLDQNLLVADYGNSVVRSVNLNTGIITTILGTGIAGSSGDGGDPLSAQLTSPNSLAFDSKGNLYISDFRSNVVRYVAARPTGTLSFPSTYVGQTSGVLQIPIRNSGNAGILLNSLQISPPFLQVIWSSKSCALSGQLPPGASCDLAIAFAPASVGHTVGTVVLNDASASHILVQLQGDAVPLSQLTVGQSRLSFTSNRPNASSQAQTVSLQNTGLLDVAISSVLVSGVSRSNFTLLSSCSIVPVGQTCNVQLSFSASDTLLHNANLSVQASDSPLPHVIQLTGLLQMPQAHLSAASVEFGPQFVGSDSNLKTVLLTNDGSAPLIVSRIDGGPEFKIESGTCTNGVQSGQSCAIGIRFSPASKASRIGSLVITDNSLDSPHVISLKGTGLIPGQSTGLYFVPINPCRLVDTRSPAGPFGAPRLYGQTQRDFTVPDGSCNLPLSAEAYAGTVTVVPTGILGYLTSWNTGQPMPSTSLLNSDGRVKAVSTILAAGNGGSISLFATQDTEVIIDISGYFTSDSSALSYFPVAPCRVADTRKSMGIEPPPSANEPQVYGIKVLESGCQIPSNAQAYALNVTAVPKDVLGYMTIWKTGADQPLASILNAHEGEVTANGAIVPAGTDGKVSIYASQTTDFVIDIQGYFASDSSGSVLFPINPCRSLDTRLYGSPITQFLSVDPTMSCGAIPSTAASYVMTATVIPVDTLGYLSLQNTWEVNSSVLNSHDGVVTSNLAIVPLGSNRSMNAIVSNPTDLVLDVLGYFGAPVH